MNDKKTYAQEIFEWRCQRYRTKARTKLPWQEATESCHRVNSLPNGPTVGLKFPDDFLRSPADVSSGNRVAPNLFDFSIEYSSVSQTVTLCGTGGKVSLDDTTCMVELARYLLGFSLPQSCGECTFCRIGTTRMIEILDNICMGRGTMEDIDTLHELAENLNQTSQCDLGSGAANPVLSTLNFFRKQYEEHVRDCLCRAGKCTFDSKAAG